MEGRPEPIDTSKLSFTTVTAADRKDLDDIEELELLTFGRAAQNVWGLVPMIAHGLTTLTRLDGEPVAWSILLADWRDRHVAFVWSFAVAQKHHQRGIGMALLEHLLARVAADGFQRVELTVSPTNARALRLLGRAGFTRSAVLPEWYGPMEDRWLMARQIAAPGT